MVRRWDTNVSPILLRARCAKFSPHMRSSRTRCATIWNAAIPCSTRRWPKSCASIAKSRFEAIRHRARAGNPGGCDHILRRKARRAGDWNDGAGPAARAFASWLRGARSRICPTRNAEPVSRHRSCDRRGSRHRGGKTSFARVCGLSAKARRPYPPSTAIKLILDNHSAHISKETKAWLAAQPEGRFTFVFTPKHGSWLNLVEGFFSKLARSALRHIRVGPISGGCVSRHYRKDGGLIEV